MNLSIVSARYVAPLKVELHFNDDTVKTIDVGAFIRNHPHPQYNSYLNENKFKKFTRSNNEVFFFTFKRDWKILIK